MSQKKQVLVMRCLIVVFIAISVVLAIIQYKSNVTFIAQLMGCLGARWPAPSWPPSCTACTGKGHPGGLLDQLPVLHRRDDSQYFLPGQLPALLRSPINAGAFCMLAGLVPRTSGLAAHAPSRTPPWWKTPSPAMTGRFWSASGRPWATEKRRDKSKTPESPQRNFLFKDRNRVVRYPYHTVSVFPTYSTNRKEHSDPHGHRHPYPYLPRPAGRHHHPKLELAAHTRSFSDGTNAGLAASMARAGVDCSLVLPVATAPKQVVHVNDCSAQINEALS